MHVVEKLGAMPVLGWAPGTINRFFTSSGNSEGRFEMGSLFYFLFSNRRSKLAEYHSEIDVVK